MHCKGPCSTDALWGFPQYRCTARVSLFNLFLAVLTGKKQKKRRRKEKVAKGKCEVDRAMYMHTILSISVCFCMHMMNLYHTSLLHYKGWWERVFQWQQVGGGVGRWSAVEGRLCGRTFCAFCFCFKRILHWGNLWQAIWNAYNDIYGPSQVLSCQLELNWTALNWSRWWRRKETKGCHVTYLFFLIKPC